VGWSLLPSSSRHHIQLRAGGGRAVGKRQVVTDTGSILEPDPTNDAAKGRSLLGGLRYGFRLGRPVSLTADIAAARLTVNRTLIQRADLLAVTFGVQIHPWGRD
jgi:hypothetical protein